MSADRVHHPYSPSTLQMREACPKYSPSQNENEAARLGTMQHDAVDSGEDDQRLADYRAVAVAQCISHAEEVAKNYPGGEIIREAYLPIDDVHTTAGYVDYAVVSADKQTAELLDWKFGRWAVTAAEENLQGIAYMLGLKHRFPTLRKCTVRFEMPHIDASFSHTFDITDPTPYLLRVRAVVERAKEAAKNPDDFSSARPNIGSCAFCALIGKCPAVGAIALKIGHKFAPLAIPADISTSVLADPKEVGMGLRLAQIIATWAEAYRRQATAKSIAEEFVPDGYMLIPSQKLAIKNARQVGEAAKKFIPAEAADKVDALYKIAITSLDDLLNLYAPRGEKEATVKKFREHLVAEGLAELGQRTTYLRQSDNKNQNTKKHEQD